MTAYSNPERSQGIFSKKVTRRGLVTHPLTKVGEVAAAAGLVTLGTSAVARAQETTNLPRAGSPEAPDLTIPNLAELNRISFETRGFYVVETISNSHADVMFSIQNNPDLENPSGLRFVYTPVIEKEHVYPNGAVRNYGQEALDYIRRKTEEYRLPPTANPTTADYYLLKMIEHGEKRVAYIHKPDLVVDVKESYDERTRRASACSGSLSPREMIAQGCDESSPNSFIFVWRFNYRGRGEDPNKETDIFFRVDLPDRPVDEFQVRDTRWGVNWIYPVNALVFSRFGPPLSNNPHLNDPTFIEIMETLREFPLVELVTPNF